MSKRVVIAGLFGIVVLVGILFWRTSVSKTPPAAIPTSSTANPPQAPATPDAVQRRVDGIVARYRKTIVLLEDEDSLSEADREQASLVGRIIFQENHEAISSLTDELQTENQKSADFSQPL